ncbi:unnamed protein product [Musa acuminata subsp. malaccensis]|uniref:(wild Malaysian banana) hypothetical protein n=1 Tax=Musa acuminata subsp. malaccensis TaxID=214687 RepID=A0A804K560_MUSAM|nr:PREDICTED: tropomyosin-like [Musa acuminata subsp. malaccensis]CAG1831165.1 unnamed protein product [Musa acuminata subsp. malaccensis]
MSTTDTVEASASSSSAVEFDPLLKDLEEKRLSFKRNVVSLATELKDVRRRLVLQEQLFARETLTRKATEKKAKSMEEDIGRLQICLREKDEKLKASTSASVEYMKDLDDLRSELSITQATSEASAASAQSAQSQFLDLLRELDEKDSLLAEHETRVNKLGEQIDLLQNDLQARELSQRRLKDEVLQMEQEIMHVVNVAGSKKDCELRKILAEVSPKNFENINKHLSAKDEEIAKLRDEIRILSAHWKQQTKELEAQLEKHRMTNEELNDRIIKLELCLQEAQNQMQTLQKMGKKRDKAIRELRDELVMKQPNSACCGIELSFWENPGFRIVASMGMLILVAFASR